MRERPFDGESDPAFRSCGYACYLQSFPSSVEILSLLAPA